MTTTSGTVRQVDVGVQVAQLLRQMLLRREFTHGERLVEERVAKRFEVSRGPVREAFRQLESEGLLETHHRRTYVVGLTADDLTDLYDLRETLELLAVRRTMDQMTPEQSSSGRALVAAMRSAAQADNHSAFADADIEFHSLLYSCSQNSWLEKVWVQYKPILSTILHTAVRTDPRLARSAEDHNHLWSLIESGKDSAVAETSAHIRRARERLIAAYIDSVNPSNSRDGHSLNAT